MTMEVLDQKARDDARDALHKIGNFQQLADVQFRGLEKKIDVTHADTSGRIDEIKNAIKWAGSLIITLMITVLGWAVVQQLNANEAQKDEMRRQIILLQQQEIARKLSASASEPTLSAVSVPK
jgi:hypothetical protein